MEKRVPYDIVYCTSQEDEYPIDELEHAAGSGGVGAAAMHQRCKGWQSARNAKMPQTIVLRFPGNVELTQLGILSHECKIASKVELRLFALNGKQMEMDPPSFRAVHFTKLGVVDFNSNEHSDYRSKERKTIHMQAVAYFVKLLFNIPHHNAHNVFNQVGVYSIDCNGRILTRVRRHSDKALVLGSYSNRVNGGELAPPSRGATLDSPRGSPQKQQEQLQTPPQPQLPPSYLAQQPQALSHSPPLTPVRDIIPSGNDPAAFRSVRILEFEEFFIRRSEELLALKDQAVAVEDFDIAKQCRDRLNLMNRRSKRIYQVEQDKVHAIIEEDFDAAKEAKRMMDAMIESVYRDAQLPLPRPDFDQYACVGDTFDGGLMPQALHGDMVGVGEERSRHKSRRDASSRGGSADSENGFNEADAYNNDGDMAMNDYAEENAAPLVSKCAQRMADKVRDITHEIDTVDPPPPPCDDADATTPKVEEEKLQAWERCVAEAIMATSSETEGPAMFNSYVKNTREALDLVGAVGMFTACCLFSRRFKLREATLDVLMGRMRELYPAPPSLIEEAVLRFFDMNGHGLQDTLPNVVTMANAFVRMVLADEYKCLSSVLAPVVNLLPRLLCCAADANPRVREEALKTLALCIKTPSLTNPTILTAVLAEPVDKERRRLPNSGQRVQVARLTVFEQLVTTGRMGLRNHTDSVWTKLLLPCINHQSRVVRDLAVSITTALVQERKLVLTERRILAIDNAAIREQIKTAVAEANLASAPAPGGTSDAVGTAATAGARGRATSDGEKARSRQTRSTSNGVIRGAAA
ncbi:hypothetical protein TraAM80_01513 [Trypanosoma rangeli]|uniref:Centrosomal protein CEP104 N-terminal domain-containing protein n=1 Tax=Trypanosoma rangeli TaxID=5698 RepID=A0A422NYA4_TRYRA|nr:uncharacterized protein TraAM80_01513 [Trypanosoma rangeli]RNF10467.1 hypothetical protein TraAM80_01513 [Trypanosoma rangeli]|eukprot:RNF10467.1 hypothetical protein TraAM80_01513 [Trypanosoma rangeli]